MEWSETADGDAGVKLEQSHGEGPRVPAAAAAGQKDEWQES